jgi:uncharacterized surface protein with fasciclin (FAS1) repeats
VKNLIYSIAVLTLLIGGIANAGSCGSGSHKHSEADKTAHGMNETSDIVVTAVESGKFKTLVAAIEAAGLVEALKGEGPFTVFAPTDEAFAELPEGTLEVLLNNPEKLKAILTYHVLDGTITSDQAMKVNAAETLNGKSITVAAKDGQVMINDANVIAADIVCKNGIIHVLDKVIMPIEESR